MFVINSNLAVGRVELEDQLSSQLSDPKNEFSVLRVDVRQKFAVIDDQ